MIKNQLLIIKRKYERVSVPVKASAWFLICSILVKGFSLISTPIFTRLLTSYQYGQIANYNSWYDLLFIFVTLGNTGAAYNNILAKNENDHQCAKLSMMIFTSLISAIWFVIYFIARNIWNKYFKISTVMMLVMFIQFLSLPIFDFWSAGERYKYRYRNLVIVTLINTFFSLCLGIIGVSIFEHKYEARIFSSVLVSFIIAIILFVKTLVSANGKINISYWNYALKISLPLIPHTLSMKILAQADRVMISNMVGVEETGKYSIAYTIGLLMNILTDAINKSFCPFIYKKINEKNVEGVASATTRLLFIVMIACCGSSLFAPEIIKLFATSEYLEAMWIVPPVAMSVYFIFLYVVFSNVEFYFEKTFMVSVLSGAVAVINILLNFVFINLFGYLAAGYTTLVCYIILAIFHWLMVKQILKKNTEIEAIFDFKSIFLVSFGGVLFVTICEVIYPYFYLRLVFAFVLLFLGVYELKKHWKDIKG